MRLTEYLKVRGESQSEFARRAGVAQKNINRICNGEGCRADTALAIIRASHDQPTPGGGTISLEDLVIERHDGAAA